MNTFDCNYKFYRKNFDEIYSSLEKMNILKKQINDILTSDICNNKKIIFFKNINPILNKMKEPYYQIKKKYHFDDNHEFGYDYKFCDICNENCQIIKLNDLTNVNITEFMNCEFVGIVPIIIKTKFTDIDTTINKPSCDYNFSYKIDPSHCEHFIYHDFELILTNIHEDKNLWFKIKYKKLEYNIDYDYNETNEFMINLNDISEEDLLDKYYTTNIIIGDYYDLEINIRDILTSIFK